MSGAYYNEFDPGAAAWLRELIKRGLIANGEVDERSILDVSANELRGFTQCHFFAGIGGWSYALRLAGWPDDRPVWTGSPPCQPFSAAGKQLGKDDARHLAPHFISLVGAGRPAVLFGEQVASAEVFGKATKRSEQSAAPAWAWFDDLSDRLEAARYAVGARDIPAAFIGAPHIRQRTFFGAVRLGDAGGSAGERDAGGFPGAEAKEHRAREFDGCGDYGSEHAGSGVGGLANADHAGPQGWAGMPECADEFTSGPGGLEGGLGFAGPWKSYSDWFSVCWHDECRNSDRGFCDCYARGAPDGWQWDPDDGWMADADSAGPHACAQRGVHRGEEGARPRNGKPERCGAASGLADATGRCGCDEREQCSGEYGLQPEDGSAFGQGNPGAQLRPDTGMGAGAPDSFWRDADWLFCRDGKWRPVEPGTFPLADGLPARVGRLRGYGNAIVPQAAAEFITAFDKAIRE